MSFPKFVLVMAVLALPMALPASSERSALGTSLPALQMEFPRGKPRIDGKAVLIEFWATWCGPCRTTIPHLNSLYDKVKNDGFVMIGVTEEASDVVEAFLEKTPMRYSLALDKDARFSAPFQVTGIPHAVLYNKTGKAVWEGHPMSLNEALLRKAMSGETEAATSGDSDIYRGITTARLRTFLDAGNVPYTLDGDGDIVATMQGLKGLMLCDKDYIQFRVATRAKAVLEFANRWNADKRYAKCYLDKEGDPVLELELDLAGGVHRDRITDFVKTCDLAVKSWLAELKKQ